ncbi:hypothetical protein Hamer_G012725 [Homarus americanus]|uniref:Uncharacterized protein n=1 Tax=Homarus americanus TaxID=6706 RepID=A0A8J5JQ04_HOMAM|nr:hypothetical protein Hamer_G012725 [Homarus americanus]
MNNLNQNVEFGDLEEDFVVKLIKSEEEEWLPENWVGLAQLEEAIEHKEVTIQENQLMMRLALYLVFVDQVIKEGIDLDLNLKQSLKVERMIHSNKFMFFS